MVRWQRRTSLYQSFIV